MTALRPHGLGAGSVSALGAPGVDPIDVAVPLLLNELESATDAVVLVLDDFHLLSDPRVHEGVEFLLAYLPASMRLVVAGRTDPPLPLPRLRARGELTEIRAEDLRFSPARSGSARDVGRGRRPGRLGGARVVRADRGVGDRAAARRDRPARYGRAGGGRRRHPGRRPAHPGLLHRRGVRGAAPAAHRDLLVRVSVLERLSGPLCDVVLERAGSTAILDDLQSCRSVRRRARPTPEKWYRCHRLFRDALRHRMDPEAAREGLGRAADWFLEQGYLEDAIEHRISAGDEQGAAELLRASPPWFLERGGSGISRLGGRLAPAVTHADPALCVTLAWATAIGGQFARMGRRRDAVEGRVDGGPPQGWHDLSGAWATLRGCSASPKPTSSRRWPVQKSPSPGRPTPPCPDMRWLGTCSERPTSPPTDRPRRCPC